MTYQLLDWPDVEGWAVDYLRDRLTGRPEPYAQSVTVDVKTPNPRPARLVQVQRAGGVSSSHVIDRPRLDVRIWADANSLEQQIYDANQLGLLIRGFLLQARGTLNGQTIYRVDEFAGPIPNTDPDSDLPRVLLSVQISMRARVSDTQ